jgi:hypothetical protein
MNINDTFPSTYIKVDDLGGGPLKLVIDSSRKRESVPIKRKKESSTSAAAPSP